MNEKICYYRQTAVDRMEAYRQDYLGWYLGEETAEPPRDAFLKANIRELESRTSASKLNVAISNSNMPETDKGNAITVYKYFQNLTPHQSSSERIWVYYCHKHRDYVASRWLGNTNKSQEDLTKIIAKRFFLSGTRGVVSDNALSRLWHMGRFAYAIEPQNPSAFLDVILQFQDIWKQSVERASVFSSIDAMTAAYLVMQDPVMSLITNRNNFRNWMKELDKKAGTIMFSALSRDDLVTIFRHEAEAVLSDAKN